MRESDVNRHFPLDTVDYTANKSLVLNYDSIYS